MHKSPFVAAALLLSSLAAAEPQRRIVVFHDGLAAADRVAVAESAGGKVVRELPLINAVVVEGEPAALKSAEGMLLGHSSVKRVDPDPKINWLVGVEPTFLNTTLPSVPAPRFERSAREDASAAAAELPWGIKRVNAPAAWPRAKGRGVKVAVIDTGIDFDHADLKANIAGGWNATDKAKPAAFKDDNGHGTHCAGTIAAVEKGGVVGVAPRASLYAVKVLDSGGNGTYDDVIAGMQWAVEHKMQVASMSLGGGGGNDSLKAAVDAMVKNGVALIAAAGNTGQSVLYPAAYPGALAVAAIDSSDKVASFSSRGPQVALAAPGVDVKSTAMGGGYTTMSGTSMATPHVAGLAALAISARRVSGYDAVRAALVSAATPVPNAPAEQQGAGVPDARRLVR